MDIATPVPQAAQRSAGQAPGQERMALEIRNLDFFYGNGFQGLNKINLTIPERKVTAFIGP